MKILAGLCLLAALGGGNSPDAASPNGDGILASGTRVGGARGSLLPGLDSPLPHAIAFVNDPLSHGILGDDYLSLNEVILLHNRALPFSQLSQNEQNQISGFGQDVAWADIDATATPTITVERDLDVIVDMPHGLLISGTNGLPVIDFTASTVQHGFRSTSNYCNWRYLVLHGGPFGIDLQQTDAIYGTYLDNVEFELQTQFAFRCTGTTPGQASRVLMRGCQFRSVPAAIQFDEQAANRTGFFFVERSLFGNTSMGLELLLGNGGNALCWLERLEMSLPGTGIRMVRPGGGDRTLTVEATHLRIAGSSAMQIEGGPTATTQVTLRMLDLLGNVQGARALDLGPVGGRITGVLEDSRLEGQVDVLTGGAATALTLGNLRVKNGAVTIGTSGVQPMAVRDCRFEACQVATTGQGAVAFDACCFAGGALQGAPTAPVQCNASYVGASTAGSVTSSAALPAEQLGSMQLLPVSPTLGNPMTVQVDLPTGLYAFLAMGVTAATPFLQAPPMHVYLDVTSVYTFPGVYRLHQGLTFPVPNTVTLAGTDWVVQMAAFPDAGVQAPFLQLPPGYRFMLR